MNKKKTAFKPDKKLDKLIVEFRFKRVENLIKKYPELDFLLKYAK